MTDFLRKIFRAPNTIHYCMLQKEEGEYIKAIKSGDEKAMREAFRELHRECGPSIVRHIMNNKGTIEDAEDIMQETLLTLYARGKAGGFEQTGSLCGFLFTVARNKWSNELRGKKVAMSVTDLLQMLYKSRGNPTPLDWVQYADLIAVVQHLLDAMPEKCRAVMDSAMHAQKSKKEQSAELGISYENYLQRLSRCRRRLKKQLERYFDERM